MRETEHFPQPQVWRPITCLLVWCSSHSNSWTFVSWCCAQDYKTWPGAGPTFARLSCVGLSPTASCVNKPKECKWVCRQEVCLLLNFPEAKNKKIKYGQGGERFLINKSNGRKRIQNWRWLELPRESLPLELLAQEAVQVYLITLVHFPFCCFPFSSTEYRMDFKPSLF